MKLNDKKMNTSFFQTLSVSDTLGAQRVPYFQHLISKTCLQQHCGSFQWSRTQVIATCAQGHQIKRFVRALSPPDNSGAEAGEEAEPLGLVSQVNVPQDIETFVSCMRTFMLQRCKRHGLTAEEKADGSRTLLENVAVTSLPAGEYRLHGHRETFLDTRRTSVHPLFGTKAAKFKCFKN